MKKILIIGAGPAGCVAACHLANQGYEVTIVEKSKFPRFTIGESLLPVSMEHFEEVGLLPALEAAGFEVKSGALFTRGATEEIDISFSEYFTKGWTWTWQVPRDDFDHLIAQTTEQKGVEIHYESTIEKIDFQKDGVAASFRNGKEEVNDKYDFVIDSSGNAGVLSSILSIKKVSAQSGRRSLFTQVKDVRQSQFSRSKRITFDVLADDLWFWVIPFSNGKTSLGFVGDARWFEEDEDRDVQFAKLLQQSDNFKSRFEGLDYLFPVRGVEDYTCQAEQLFGDRFVMVGNTAGFIDPVFSSGVAMATSSGLLAAKLVDRQLSGETVDWSKEYAEYMKGAGEVFGAFVNTWYSGDLHEVFFHSNIRMDIKKQLTSVLAGYVWDTTNPFVVKKEKLIKTLAKVIKLENQFP
ncbi:Dehydrogenase (flavoprotein) [Reichenbachiella faecimaris]|uniref:Dehydrogenase (Flavoprotein) n=1 Tax=Reichenbachiella faecimaris TaxID=692418 RepID=A0A1W2G688_REIFA|nr:NAD(P)/FAD-dependent oxidoreductase [Reichenbachiella faecimaris]SMD32190.1 Dehydrogenase (flavoprotein) [Reichenbachiella faecimaris]